jgi:hypothetical protein
MHFDLGKTFDGHKSLTFRENVNQIQLEEAYITISGISCKSLELVRA